jgi:hypothetical protein
MASISDSWGHVNLERDGTHFTAAVAYDLVRKYLPALVWAGPRSKVSLSRLLIVEEEVNLECLARC